MIKTKRAKNPHPNPNVKGRVQPIRFSTAEWKAIKANADKYAGGNMSAFIRFAAMNYSPRK